MTAATLEASTARPNCRTMLWCEDRFSTSRKHPEPGRPAKSPLGVDNTVRRGKVHRRTCRL